jgi:hypothetical protein
LQGFPRKCVPNAQCDDVVNSVREMGIDCKLLVSSRLPPRVRINNWGNRVARGVFVRTSSRLIFFTHSSPPRARDEPLRNSTRSLSPRLMSLRLFWLVRT